MFTVSYTLKAFAGRFWQASWKREIHNMKPTTEKVLRSKEKKKEL